MKGIADDKRAIDELATAGLTAFFSGLIADMAALYPDGCLRDKKALLVHSSLSAFGFVPGAERSVTEALVRSCARAGFTLIMPAHGGNNRAGKDCISMGRIPDYFRRRRGTKRSSHPDLSFCAFGPLAKEVIKDHRAQNGVGMKSPTGKLYRMDALVLMLGTGFETCTVMHLAEYAEAERLRAENMVPDTVMCWCRGKSWEEPAFYPERFPSIGEAFEKEKPGHIVIRPLPGEIAQSNQAGQEVAQRDLTLRELAPRELAHRPLARAMRIRELVDFSIDRYRYLR